MLLLLLLLLLLSAAAGAFRRSRRRRRFVFRFFVFSPLFSAFESEFLLSPTLLRASLTISEARREVALAGFRVQRRRKERERGKRGKRERRQEFLILASFSAFFRSPLFPEKTGEDAPSIVGTRTVSSLRSKQEEKERRADEKNAGEGKRRGKEKQQNEKSGTMFNCF